VRGVLSRHASRCAQPPGVTGDVWFHEVNGPQAIEQVDQHPHPQIKHAIPDRTWLRNMVGVRNESIWYANGSDRSMNRLDPRTSATVGASGSVWLGGDSLFTEISTDGTIESTIPSPARPLGMASGAVIGVGDAEIFFVSSGLGFSRLESDGSIGSRALSGLRTGTVVDGQGHVWVNDGTSSTLLWM
jgi:hypothetical protein